MLSLFGPAIAVVFVALAAHGVEAGTLYVTNRGSGELAILDESSLTVRKIIPVGERAWGVAVAPDRKTACVSYAGGLAIVDLEAGAVAQRVALGGQGMGVVTSRDGALCYVAVHLSGGDRLFADAFAVSVIEAASLVKRHTISLKPLGEGAFDKPHYLAMTSDGATLYLPFQGRALVAINTSSFTVTAYPLTINAHQHGIAISPDGRRLYLANSFFGGEGSLSELDAKTFRELRRINLGKDHEQVALDSAGRRAYLTGGFALGGHDELTVVDLESGTLTRVGTAGTRPFAILRLP